MPRREPNRAVVLFALLLIVPAIALVRDTFYQGQDFEVFWRAGRAFFEDRPIYELYPNGMVFKYPPWILPLFLPFSLLPLATAKILWGCAEVVSLGLCILWLIRAGCSRKRALFVAAAFWGIWAVHALDGQVTLPLLAISLWATRSGRFSSAVFAALSAKVFTLFSLLGLKWQNWRRTVVFLLSFLSLLSIPALKAQPQHSVSDLFDGWKKAASSGGELLEGAKVRGRDNQGFPALLLRMKGVDSGQTQADLFAFGVVALIFSVVGFKLQKGMGIEERWALWLALGAVVHPLAWFHLFVLAFPLAVFAVDRSLTIEKNTAARVLALLGVACMALITRRTMGPFGEQLELLSVKSWGVLLSAFSLAASSRIREIRSKVI